MRISRWPAIQLPGDAHQIPRTCPNCLAPADHARRYKYRKRFFLVPFLEDSTSVEQTFNYCSDCATYVDRWQVERARRKIQFFVIPVVVVIGLFCFGLSSNLFHPGGRTPANPVAGYISLLAGVGLLLAAIGTPIITMLAYRHRVVVGSNKAVYGPAVFCTKIKRPFFKRGATATYRAAQSEWLQALAKLNQPEAG